MSVQTIVNVQTVVLPPPPPPPAPPAPPRQLSAAPSGVSLPSTVAQATSETRGSNLNVVV